MQALGWRVVHVMDRLSKVTVVVDMACRSYLMLLPRWRRCFEVFVVIVIDLRLRSHSVVNYWLLVKFAIVNFVSLAARARLVDQAHLLWSSSDADTNRLERSGADSGGHALGCHVLFHVSMVEDGLGRGRRFLVGLQEFEVVVLLLRL